MAARQALRLCEAEQATRTSASLPTTTMQSGRGQQRTTTATTRAALRAAGLPPQLAASLRGRLRLIPGQEREQ